VDESEGWVYVLGAKLNNDDDDEGGEQGAQARSAASFPIPIPAPSGEPRTRRNGTANGDAMDVEGETNGAMEPERGREREERKNMWASDFWRYKAVGAGKDNWELLSKDTSVEGGPKLLCVVVVVVSGVEPRAHMPRPPQIRPSDVRSQRNPTSVCIWRPMPTVGRRRRARGKV
jgi:hypothetical protein